MAKPLSILYVASEVVPFAKTGGLADVSGSLPQVVRELGHDIRIFMPKYAAVSDRKFKIHDIKRLTDIPIQIGDETYLGSVKSSFITNIKTKVQVYFLSNAPFYDREDLYVDPKTKTDYPDNDTRFIFFCRSVLETLKLLGWQPDILHINDWQTGLVAPYAKLLYANEPSLKNIKIVLTVHNAAYQGIFPKASFTKTGLPDKVFNNNGVENHGNMNFLKAGLMYADAITTVSETYAKEIRTHAEHGAGLEEVFSKKKSITSGILNGMDNYIWSPDVDTLIPVKYSSSDISGKQENKKALVERFKLQFNDKTPVIGMVSRLVDQKGLDIIVDAIDDLMGLNCQLVILGLGEQKYQDTLTKAAKKYGKKMSIVIGFNESLAHLVEAGSDIFLMPSKYEPCGLNQLYSLRYGTLPIVRATGGLADTVIDLDAKPLSGTGFVFQKYQSKELVKTVKRALGWYQERDKWSKAMLRAMSMDFSWNVSAQKYIELYKSLLKK